jgi:hypothetical protein
MWRRHNEENTIHYATLYNNSNKMQMILYTTRIQEFIKVTALWRVTLLVLWLGNKFLQETAAFIFKTQVAHICTTTEHGIPEKPKITSYLLQLSEITKQISQILMPLSISHRRWIQLPKQSCIQTTAQSLTIGPHINIHHTATRKHHKEEFTWFSEEARRTVKPV